LSAARPPATPVRSGPLVLTAQARQAMASLEPVRRGTVIARRDLRGGAVVDGTGEAREAGRNLRHAETPNQEIFLAACDGLCTLRNGIVGIEPVLVVDGDVDHTHGALRHQGALQVRGSLRRGVTVSGDAVVAGDVADGVQAHIGGNLVVWGSIRGRGTCVEVAGDLQVAGVLLSRVTVAGRTVVDGDVQGAVLRCHGEVRVAGSEAPARVVGADILSCTGIHAQHVGAGDGRGSVLSVGIAPAQVQTLDDLDRRLHDSHREVSRVARRLGLDGLDLEALRTRLQATTGLQRRVLQRQARLLAAALRAHRARLQERRSLLDGVVAPPASFVRVDGAMERGSRVRLGSETLDLGRQVQGLHWRAGEPPQLQAPP
jgi:hypothetical protein